MKDGPDGVLYSDQNEQPPPLVIMGWDYAGELVGGTLAIQLSAVNSQAVADGASISSYAWAAVPTAGASFDNAAIAAPILTLTSDNTRYQISCTVTDDNSKSSIAHRAYMIGGAVTEFDRSTITETYDRESVSTQIPPCAVAVMAISLEAIRVFARPSKAPSPNFGRAAGGSRRCCLAIKQSLRG